MDAKTPPANEQKKVFWITVGYVGALFIIMGVLSYLLWDKGSFTIAYVPVPVLQWSFLGGMIAVLHRLAYRRSTPGIALYTWVVAKPIIGLVMGAVVYFIALGGGRLVGADMLKPDGQPKDFNTILWLNALAFIGGFSDRFSVDLINRITGGFIEKLDKGASDQEKSNDGR